MSTVHWSELLMEDHRLAEQVLDAVEKCLARPQVDPAVVRDALTWLVEYVDRCHNHKEEDHLFPLAEASGIPRGGGPLAVMLAEHGQSRELLERLIAAGEAFVGGDAGRLPELREVFADYAGLMRGHFWKENDILYPMARRVLSEEDDAAVVRGIAEVEAGLEGGRASYDALAAGVLRAGDVRDLVHGVPPDLLGAILNTLPLELSFVDAEDRVRYFSHENQEKIFPRNRGAIGRAVQQCHPQKSVHLVNGILEDFKAGRREVAEFWIDFLGKKVHIRYFAVRGPDGAYQGCLETVQDVTAIQALTGQRRLLDDAA